MRLATPTGNYERTTGRRRRQLAAMPTIWCNARVMKQAANRAHNKMQARAHTPTLIGINVAGWTPPITRVFDSGLSTVAILAG